MGAQAPRLLYWIATEINDGNFVRLNIIANTGSSAAIVSGNLPPTHNMCMWVCPLHRPVMPGRLCDSLIACQSLTIHCFILIPLSIEFLRPH